MKRCPLSARIRYRFDDIMARGVSAQIRLLAVATGINILAGRSSTNVPGGASHPQRSARGEDTWLVGISSVLAACPAIVNR